MANPELLVFFFSFAYKKKRKEKIFISKFHENVIIPSDSEEWNGLKKPSRKSILNIMIMAIFLI